MKRIIAALIGLGIAYSMFSCQKPKDTLKHIRTDASYYVLWHLPQGIRGALDQYTTFDFDYSRFAITLNGGLYLKVDSIESAGRLVKIELPGAALSTRNVAMAIDFYGWAVPAQTGKPNYAVFNIEDGFLKIKGKNVDTTLGKGVWYLTKAGKVLPGGRQFFMVSADGLLYDDEITLGELCRSIEGIYSIRVVYDERFSGSVLYNVDIDIRKSLAAQLPAFAAAGSFNFTLDSYNRVLNIRPK
ncbi:hypothetical protein [Chitinophaga filiformis]|uniref:Uncharacterized protein n=1 Tax=Chitinophaga filiformis TaxID=104663 RepID=A0A1G7MHZ8_CHIFI|nr:hypothetical protein [Chitinophaga filiformis]SDF61333.1 hypothetical protein SAMN04488121_102439 [Chitinophaga filiformis]